MDTLFISGLKLKTRIGVYPWEQHVPQTIILDIELKTRLQKAAASHDLNDTIDYAALSDALVTYLAQGQWQLIETLAEDIVKFIFAHFSANHIKLTLHKIHAVRRAKSVGLMIERNRND